VARHGQRPILLLVTGAADRGAERKAVAKGLEARLFAEGRLVYFLGMASVLYGVDADLDRRREQRAEHMRRLAEVANILLDAGTILIVTAAELAREDLDLITTSVNPEQIVTVWLGEDVTTDVHCELSLRADDEAVERLTGLLAGRGVFDPEARS
jgi:bifunctional enzyme CysN/CysC